MSRLTPWVLAAIGLGLAGPLGRADTETGGRFFRFRMPHPVTYWTEDSQELNRTASGETQWLKVRLERGSTNVVELSSRVVVQLRSAGDLKRLTAGGVLTLSRVVTSNGFILQAPDAQTAATEAERLAAIPEVLASYPVMRRPVSLHGPYASRPTDFFYGNQWPLEQRHADGAHAGVDLNVRAAWPYTLGQGVTIAVADTGIEMTHPELAGRVAGAPHFNFYAQNTNAGPISGVPDAAHGTEVAGLAAAQINNARMVGVAPGARLASWVVFNTNFATLTDEGFMDMYQYASNVVSVQNHSWANSGLTLAGPSLLEQVGLSNALNQGRSGRGVVMVRSAGNDRTSGANANDDGYVSDPRVVAVVAVRIDGRVASYSEPGACVLVGAPSGDTGLNGLLTTDLLGTRGANQLNFSPPYQDMNGYVFDSLGFTHTSAAAPQIAGVVALILSANSNLTYRDVQQILILSSRHFDFADPDLTANGAGFLVSHNDGFGVPDAGVAVNLARSWISRPGLTNVTLTATNVGAIADDGLRMLVTDDGVPTNLASIRCLPGTGPHADEPTLALPLVDFGIGTNLSFNLTNKGALILRGGGVLYAAKISNAATAGAAFAVIYNYPTNGSGDGGDQLKAMGGTDFTPIPAVFIGNSDGVALQVLFETNGSALAQIRLDSTNCVFAVTNTLLCEHVALRVQTDHSFRGDLRITLVSPMGTRSVLQRYNLDQNPGPIDWTYYSTHHFYESSAGNWTAYFSDESAGDTGTVHSASLSISGVPIRDRDRNGLDDFWEITYFDSIFTQSPEDDPDRDGYSNAREQIMGTHPLVADVPFQLNLSRWNQNVARLSWPATTNFTYEVWGGTNAASLVLLTNVPGRFPETEWFTAYSSLHQQFFRVRAIPVPKP